MLVNDVNSAANQVVYYKIYKYKYLHSSSHKEIKGKYIIFFIYCILTPDFMWMSWAGVYIII